MRHNLIRLITTAFFIIPVGCATVQEKEQMGATALKQGMAPFEVVHLLGIPSKVYKFYDKDVLYLYNTVRVVFRDNVLSFAFDSSEPVYVYKVDSLGDNSVFKKSIYFMSGNSEIADNDLNFREYVSQLEKAARAFGIRVASDKTNADTLVLVDFKNVKQKETKISTRLVTTSVYFSPKTTSTSFTGGGSATSYTSGQIGMTQTPITESETVVYYDRFLSCEAVAAKEYLASKRKIPQWKVVLSGTGSWGDFRRVFGTMALSAARAFNKNTGGQVDALAVANDPYLPSISSVYEPTRASGWFAPPNGGQVYQYEGLANKELLNSSEPSGINLLSAAAITGDVPAVRRLVEAGADPNCNAPGGEPLLINLVKNHNYDLARTLVELGADPTISIEVTDGGTSERHSAIFYAKANKKTDLVKYFEDVIKTRRSRTKASL